MFSGVLPQTVIGSVAIRIADDFSFTKGDLGLAVGMTFAGALVTSAVAGPLVRTAGVLVSAAAGALAIAAADVLIVTVAHGPPSLIALMTLAGLGNGAVSASMTTLLAVSVRAERRGTALGILTAAPQLAALAGGLALPFLADPFGWRAAFAAPVAVPIVAILALAHGGWLRARPPEQGAGRARAGGREYLAAVAAMLVTAPGMALRSFLVVFAISAGFATSHAALLLSATGLAALVSRIGSGMLEDWRPGRPFSLAACLMAVCAAGFALLALGGPWIVVGAVLAGGIGWGWHSPLTTAVASGAPATAASAVGMQLTGFYAGALLGPPLVGLLAEDGAYSVAWTACALSAGAAVGATLLARHLAPRRR